MLPMNDKWTAVPMLLQLYQDFLMWKKVKLGSRVSWKTANGDIVEATVTSFTSPESYIGIRTEDAKEYEIYIESICGVQE